MDAKWTPGAQINRQEWDDFVAESPQGCLYVRSGFMDAIAPEWSAVEVRVNGKLAAVLPLSLKEKAGVGWSFQPPFAAWWGLVCAAPKAGTAQQQQYAHLRRLSEAAINALPKRLRAFVHGFSPAFAYPMEWHHQGFTLRTRYTYQLSPRPEEALMAGFEADLRQVLRKQDTWAGRIQRAASAAGLIQLLETVAAAGKPVLKPAEIRIAERLAAWLYREGCGYVLEVQDAEGQCVAAGLYGHAQGYTHNLVSVVHKGRDTRGATQHLLYRAIQEAFSRGETFDFEGSMLPGVEPFFRGFGGHLQPWLFITRNHLPLPVRWIKNLP